MEKKENKNKVSIMKQERDWPSLDLQMAKTKNGFQKD